MQEIRGRNYWTFRDNGCTGIFIWKLWLQSFQNCMFLRPFSFVMWYTEGRCASLALRNSCVSHWGTSFTIAQLNTQQVQAFITVNWEWCCFVYAPCRLCYFDKWACPFWILFSIILSKWCKTYSRKMCGSEKWTKGEKFCFQNDTSSKNRSYLVLIHKSVLSESLTVQSIKSYWP